MRSSTLITVNTAILHDLREKLGEYNGRLQTDAYCGACCVKIELPAIVYFSKIIIVFFFCCCWFFIA